MTAKREGYRSCMAFVIQRADAERFTANWETDEAFSDTLKTAQKSGVEIFAFSCKVTRRGVDLHGPLPVVL